MKSRSRGTRQSPGSKATSGSRASLRIRLIVILIFCGFALFACTQNGSEPRYAKIKGNQAFEATIFRQNCAICHGPEANGKFIDGRQVPSLRIGDASKKSLEEIYEQIAHGKLPMPSFEGQLTETQMRDMARFIYVELQGRKLNDPAEAEKKEKPQE